LFIVAVGSGQDLRDRPGFWSGKKVEEVLIGLVRVRRRRRVRVEGRRSTRASKNRISTGKYELIIRVSPVVDIRGREGNASGILDIQVRFYTGFCLVVHTAMNKDRRKVGTDCILAEFIEKGLINNFILHSYGLKRAEMDSPANQHSLHIL